MFRNSGKICVYTIDSNKQIFFSLEFENILLQMDPKAVKKAPSLFYFSSHSELETGLFFQNSFGSKRGNL